MSPAATLGAVLLAYLPAAVSPGPNFVLIAHTAAAGTRRAAVAVALGVVAAGGVLAAVAVFGLGSVLARAPWLATTLRVVCGGYLAWLGLRLWWRARAPEPDTGTGRENAPRGNEPGGPAAPGTGKPLHAPERRENEPDRPAAETGEPHHATDTRQAELADAPAPETREPHHATDTRQAELADAPAPETTEPLPATETYEHKPNGPAPETGEPHRATNTHQTELAGGPTPETGEPHRTADPHQAELGDPQATDGAEPPRPTAAHARGGRSRQSRSGAGPPKPAGFFRQGVVSNLTNPKAAAFFGSVLTATLPPTEPTPVKAAAVALIVVASTAWHLSVALLFSSPATQRWYAHAKPALNRVVGTILVVLGITLAVTP